MASGNSDFPQQGGFGHHHTSSVGGFSGRNVQRSTNIPTINTDRLGQSSQMGTDQTPGTAFGNMNFTPLLPTDLLLGSPFQPGSPNAFGSPQFQSFGNFVGGGQSGQQQVQQSQLGMQGQNHTGLSPSLLQTVLSPTIPNSNGFFGANPQSPSGGMGGFGGQQMNLGPVGAPMQVTPGMMSGTSRTVYLGNIPPETSAEEILGHVRSGQIESVRLLPDKNCAFISFLDSSSATHFHSDAILKKLSIKGQDVKIGWGKPSQVPTSVALAVQQSGASRNVYLGNLPEDISEEELREDLSKFGLIDTIKLVREKNIGFVHFLSIGNAVKAVSQLPQEAKWGPPRRVYYGKDRCAYVSKTQQQNAAQYLGIAPGFAHVLQGADRDLISNALAQQSVAAAAVATSAGGVNNLGNRTVYLGNIHPETTIEEICNVVRGGLLHHIRYIPDKHICFVTFIDPTSAASFYALSNLQGLMIHNRRLKIGWGKHSGALPPAIALAVSGGASRNVYIGNLDETWTEERLRQDFSEYGEIELVNALREKSCAFVNFTNIANAIKAIEAMRGKDEYKRFKINFGKDRCGNPPRQMNMHHHAQQNGDAGSIGGGTPVSAFNGSRHSPSGPGAPGSDPSSILNGGNNNPLMMYLQAQQQGAFPPPQQHHQYQQQHDYLSAPGQAHQPFSTAQAQAAFYSADHSPQSLTPNSQVQLHVPSGPSHGASASFSMANGTMSGSGSSLLGGSSLGGNNSSSNTIGGLLAPSTAGRGSSHSRAISLPVFSQGPFSQPPSQTTGLGLQGQSLLGSHHGHGHHHQASLSGFGGLSGLGSGSTYGLAISGDGHGQGILPGWAEEEIGAQ